MNILKNTNHDKKNHHPHLRNVIDITNPSAPRDLRRLVLILIQFDVDVLRDLWERIRRIARPEEVLRVEVVRAFWLRGLRRRGRGDGNTVEVHLQAVGDEGLVGPPVGDEGGEVDVAVED